tara:strand:- start:124 stop:1134 length:1011 start_codon:yes stop_codon:yes gene_type:complete
MKILVTGGAGYLGSHTCIELIKSGYQVVVVDNLCNSSLESLKRVEKIVNCKIPFYKIDLTNRDELVDVFKNHSIDGVIHFAGRKVIGESQEKPIEYYNTNVGSSIVLASVMKEYDCKSLIFSSSASVYGDTNGKPVKENFPLSIRNPYGRSKLVIEEFLNDVFLSDNNWHIAVLRYFNPIGAHKSGLIGEEPNAYQNNLLPSITKVAMGKTTKLRIFGGDYATSDGTGVRDYIHVVDIAIAHVKALVAINKKPQVLISNLGTGKGYSVLEIVKAFEKASKKVIPFEIVGKRYGDTAICYADPTFAEIALNWKSKYDLDAMCQDTWRWNKMNPNGYN